LTNIQVVPAEDILRKWDEAERIIGKIDTGDIPFIALALSIKCDGIWSDDNDLKRQSKVKVWSTREMIQGI
jgi:predicted nucleic acid-binding protein